MLFFAILLFFVFYITMKGELATYQGFVAAPASK